MTVRDLLELCQALVLDGHGECEVRRATRESVLVRVTSLDVYEPSEDDYYERCVLVEDEHAR